MIPEVGDWLYFPTDTWKGIYKIVDEVIHSDGREGFIVEVCYSEFVMHQSRKFVERKDFDSKDMDGPMIVAHTDEEKKLMESILA